MKRSLVILCLTTLAALLLCFIMSPPRAEAFKFAVNDYNYWPSTPESIAVADFNNDGWQDLATASVGTWGFAISLNNGSGRLGDPYAMGNIGIANGCWCVAAGDLNGDGNQDLALGNVDGDSVSILLGDGSGGVDYEHLAQYAVGGRDPIVPSSIAVADFNNDGKPDVVTTDSNGVSVLLGDGSGGLGGYTEFAAGASPISIAVGDFNGDGKQDLVTANQAANSVSVLLGDGDGSFQAAVDYAVGQGPQSVAVGDFNGDGKQDLVTANQAANSVSVLLGDGAGGFGPKTDYPTGLQPWSVAVGDFNGDGKQDLVTANSTTHRPWVDRISVLRNRGGGFALKADFAAGGVCVVTGDFNGDGKPDLATEGYNRIRILRNATRPTIAALKPAQGRVGTTVTIVGSPAGWSFGASRGTSKVYFGSKAVTKYVSWSKYQIKVKVPSLTKGKKAVTVKTSAGRSNVKYFTAL